MNGTTPKTSAMLSRYLAWETQLTFLANQLHETRPWRALFTVASRLGNGSGWYALLFFVAVRDGPAAYGPLAAMLLSAALGVILYWTIKRLTARPRPCAVHPLRVSVPPLDQYSFPSGHTLHAVNFTVQLTAYAPEMAFIAVPFALLVAASRIVLGLHYLSDVAAGALIGLLLALVGWELGDTLIPHPAP